MDGKIARNTIVNVVAQLGRMGISLFLAPFVIRALGDAAYGVWVLISSFSVTGYLSFLDLGIQSSVVKYVAEFKAKNDSLSLNAVINTALIGYLGLGLCGSCFLVIFGYFVTVWFNIPNDQVVITHVLFYILALQIAFEFPGLAMSGALEGLQRYDLLRTVELGRAVVYAVAVWIVLSRGYGVIGLAAVVFGTSLGQTVLILYLVRQWLPEWHFRLSFSPSILRKMLVFSSKVFFLRINGIIYNSMDKLIIGAFLITSVLTDYDIAMKIHTIALMPMGFIVSVIIPAASSLQAKGDTRGLQQLFLKGTKYTVALSLPLVAVLMVLADSILRTWIGPIYARNTGITQLFLSYLIFWSLPQMGWNILVGMNQVSKIIPIQVVSVAVNLMVSLVATPRLGVSGVILGTVVGNLVALFPYLWLELHTLEISWRKFINHVVLTTYPQVVIISLILWRLQNLRPPQSLVEVGGYASLGLGLFYVLFYFTGLTIDERQYLIGFVRVSKNL